MTIQLNISNVILQPELNAAQITITPTLSSGKGITPEEREKLAGIEENANDYTHPETHPASILDVVDVVNGDASKFLNERGEMVAVAHENLTDKNSEPAFQHIDTTTTKTTLDEADKVALYDSVTGKVVLSNVLGDINTALETILAIEV